MNTVEILTLVGGIALGMGFMNAVWVRSNRTAARLHAEYYRIVDRASSAKDAHIACLRGQLTLSRTMTVAALHGDTVALIRLCDEARAACAEDVKS
jgi:hypothetical protein